MKKGIKVKKIFAILIKIKCDSFDGIKGTLCWNWNPLFYSFGVSYRNRFVAFITTRPLFFIINFGCDPNFCWYFIIMITITACFCDCNTILILFVCGGRLIYLLVTYARYFGRRNIFYKIVYFSFLLYGIHIWLIMSE